MHQKTIIPSYFTSELTEIYCLDISSSDGEQVFLNSADLSECFFHIKMKQSV